MKYAVCPGWVTSINDGDRHFITFSKLCDLYHVDPKDCVDMSRPESYLQIDTSKLRRLRPSKYGNYTL